ncbi:MAG: endonuclease/exonuclease/phosphatase family protein [Woeseiaceae bacterium]
MKSRAMLIALATVTGCATFDESVSVLAGVRISESGIRSVSPAISSSANMNQHPGVDGVQMNPDACSNRLVGNNQSVLDELDSENIRLLNWNIRKGGDPNWTIDLADFQGDPDLMFFQEASLGSSAWGVVTDDLYHSFSPGYRSRRSLTGVMTVSTAKPLTQCNFVTVEPWIRTPKATVITEYGLTETNQTLLVVNIHAVNFTFGTRGFQEQIRQAQSVLDDHAGPILLSGDFNTWRRRRSEILVEITDSLGLETIQYDEDNRKRVFGQPLDHIYVRGLEVLEATTRNVTSSDHNPMSARVRLRKNAQRSL